MIPYQFEHAWHPSRGILMKFGMEVYFIKKWKHAKISPLAMYQSWDRGTYSQTLFTQRMLVSQKFYNQKSYLFDNNSSILSAIVLKFGTHIVFCSEEFENDVKKWNKQKH